LLAVRDLSKEAKLQESNCNVHISDDVPISKYVETIVRDVTGRNNHGKSAPTISTRPHRSCIVCVAWARREERGFAHPMTCIDFVGICCKSVKERLLSSLGLRSRSRVSGERARMRPNLASRPS
jgi:hypothetical protein